MWGRLSRKAGPALRRILGHHRKIESRNQEPEEKPQAPTSVAPRPVRAAFARHSRTNRGATRQVRAACCLMPLSKPFPVQTFLDNFLEHGQRDKEAETHAHGADSTGIDPPVERGARDAAAGAPAEKVPGVGGSEHGQESRRRFGILPPEGWNWSSNGVGLHGETIPPIRFTVDRRQSSAKAYSAFLLASARISSGCFPQHKLDAFLR